MRKLWFSIFWSNQWIWQPSATAQASNWSNRSGRLLKNGHVGMQDKVFSEESIPMRLLQLVSSFLGMTSTIDTIFPSCDSQLDWAIAFAEDYFRIGGMLLVDSWDRCYSQHLRLHRNPFPLAKIAEVVKTSLIQALALTIISPYGPFLHFNSSHGYVFFF